MSAKEEAKKKDTQNLTVSKKPTEKVKETDDMVKRIFYNALAEMKKRELAIVFNSKKDGRDIIVAIMDGTYEE